MNINKENVKYVQRKPATKIPIPKEPLPLLPKHLIVKKQREPLKIIQTSNENVPSTSSQSNLVHEKENTERWNRKIMKHVTKRSSNENDWTENVFEDSGDSLISKIVSKSNIKLYTTGTCESGIAKPVNGRNVKFAPEPSLLDKAFILISDDDDDEINKVEINNKDCQQSRQTTKTPAVPIEHKTVKNVKKSLKRPHSRELQGILTPTKQVKKVEDKAKRHLLPYLEETIRTPDYWKKAYTTGQNSYTDDIISYLSEAENASHGMPVVRSEMRTSVINWLIRINGSSGNPEVIQTACWYLDSVLAAASVPCNKLRAVAAACYWISQKIHGTMFSAKKLASYSRHEFTVEFLIAIEFKVLQKLGFPRQPVIPQDFIPYLAWLCDSQHPGEIEVAATFICMCGYLVTKTLCMQSPSVIAVASVKNALFLLDKTSVLPRLESCPLYGRSAEKELQLTSVDITTLLRLAVLRVNELDNSSLIEYFNLPPYCIAQKITEAAERLTSEED